MSSLENDVDWTDAGIGCWGDHFFCVPKETKTENLHNATEYLNQTLTELLIVLSRKQDTLYH